MKNKKIKCDIYTRVFTTMQVDGYSLDAQKEKLKRYAEFQDITANASQIPWQLDNEENSMLPVMQSDIMLQSGEKVLIIDAKYYEHSTQVQFDKHTLHSGNLYQIFTYVKNKEYELREKNHTVSGMLLYAKTDEEIYPNNVYQMSGNQITVRTLDLNLPFDEIAGQLNTIAKTHFDL